MAAELERKRTKPGEEEGGKRAKRPRLDEDSAGSEQELALLPSDEDLFTPPVGGREDGEKDRLYSREGKGAPFGLHALLKKLETLYQVC